MHGGAIRLIAIAPLLLAGGRSPITADAQTGPQVEFNGNVLCPTGDRCPGVLALVDLRVGEPQGHFEVLEFELEVKQQPQCNFVGLKTRLFTPSGVEMEYGPWSFGKVGSELQQGKSYIESIRFPKGDLSKAGTVKVWPECHL